MPLRTAVYRQPAAKRESVLLALLLFCVLLFVFSSWPYADYISFYDSRSLPPKPRIRAPAALRRRRPPTPFSFFSLRGLAGLLSSGSWSGISTTELVSSPVMFDA